MTQWKKVRKWEKVSLRHSLDGFEILLDDTRLLTPKKETVVLTTRKLALSVAQEWERQEKFVDPATMPITRFVNSAIDKGKVERPLVIDNLLDYAETDLICYRVKSPDDLVELQNVQWNPVLHWARKELGISLKCVYGILHEKQLSGEIEKIRTKINRFDHFTLTAFSEFVTISGSILLALAVYFHYLRVEEAWKKSVLDEVWQCSKWGQTGESIRIRENKLKDFKFAYEFLTLLK